MGIIQSQGLKHLFVQFAGIAISALAILFVYPLALSTYGLVQSLIAASSFIAPMILFGSTVISVRYFPEFRNEEKGHYGFLGWMLLISLAGFLVFLMTYPFLEGYIVRFFFDKTLKSTSDEFLLYLVPLTFSIAFARIFALHASNFQRIVVPSIMEDFLIRVTLPVLIILYFKDWIFADQVLLGVMLTYLAGLAGLIIYVKSLGQLHLRPNFAALSWPKVKEMASFGAYGLLNGLGSKTALYIDTLMVSALIDFENTGIYSISLFIANTMGQPIRSIIGIAQPIISSAFARGDMEEVKMIYQKSSINLLIFGIFLFLGIWTCIDDIFQIMPNTEPMMAGKYVVFFLALAKLTDMATSVNNEVINYSKYYRFVLYTILLLAFLNVVFNLTFIPRFHILGAALATLCSLAIFNLVKMVFIYQKFGFLPFTSQTPKLILTGMLVYLLVFWIPDSGNPVVNILLKGGLVTLVYPLAIYKLEVSQEYNLLFKKYVSKFLPFLAPIL